MSSTKLKSSDSKDELVWKCSDVIRLRFIVDLDQRVLARLVINWSIHVEVDSRGRFGANSGLGIELEFGTF